MQGACLWRGRFEIDGTFGLEAQNDLFELSGNSESGVPEEIFR